jgi:hypothetical protein
VPIVADVARKPVSRDEVAIVRVEIVDPAGDALLVDLLEVGRNRRSDRRIGRATDPSSAGRMLREWLVDVIARTRDS